MLLEANKFIIKTCDILYFSHNLAQSCSITVLNTRYKNVCKEVGEVTVVHVGFSTHCCQHVFDIFFLIKFEG